MSTDPHLKDDDPPPEDDRERPRDEDVVTDETAPEPPD